MAARAAGTRTPARQSRPVGPPPRSAAEAAALRGVPPAWEQDSSDDEVMEPGVFTFEPVRLTDPAGAEAAPQVTLFWVGDQPYTVAAEPRMDVGLEMIELAMTDPLGEAAAQRYMFLEMLGEDGYAAFRKSVRRPGDYRKVVAILTRLTVGAVEAPKE